MRDESQRTRNQGSESKNDESALSKKKQLEQINIDPFKYDWMDLECNREKWECHKGVSANN